GTKGTGVIATVLHFEESTRPVAYGVGRNKLMGLVDRGVMNNCFRLLRQVVYVLDNVKLLSSTQYHINARDFSDFLWLELRIATYNGDIGGGRLFERFFDDLSAF